MAALRLGVGDVFTVCKSVVDLCAKVTTTNHEEMKDVRLLVAEMEMMREHLSAVQQNLSHNETGKGGVEKDVYVCPFQSLTRRPAVIESVIHEINIGFIKRCF